MPDFFVPTEFVPAILRETVDGARPSPRAMRRPESPAATPREISSRSAKESRRPDGDLQRGLRPPVAAITRV